MREFGFELAVCAGLESDGRLVARQLSGGIHGSRIIDCVVVEPGPTFNERTRITSETIPPRLIEADLGPGTPRRPHEVLDGSSFTEDAIAAGVECGYLTRERQNGQQYVRATTRYPDAWFTRLIGVENKPDLGRPGALETQLQKDVSLAVFDQVWLATASHVTGAHLNRIPDAVGIWRVCPETGARTVVREPEPLPSDGTGIELIERRPARAEVRPVSPGTKASYRRRIAERAYGKGWRVPFPDCPHVEERSVAGVGGLPYCTRQERFVRPADACEIDGTGPAVDIKACRAANSPWVANPPGTARRQAGLDRYNS